MRHKYFGRKLHRTKNERRRLFQGLVRDLIVHGTIKTTLAKARAVQPIVEQLVTHAKKGTLGNFNQIQKVTADRVSLRRLKEDATTRFANRTSGFTHIIKLGVRQGDNAQEVLFSFVDARVEAEVITPKKKMAEKVKKQPKNPKAPRKRTK